MEINDVLIKLIREYNISIVALAEYNASVKNLLNQLNDNGIEFTEYPSKGCDRITLFGEKDINIEPARQSYYASIQIINNKDILCCVHLNSKMYSDNGDEREIVVERIVRDIQSTENELQTSNTVIVGDFNVNPYERECVNARYFHSLPIYTETKRKSRIVAKERFYMFYNPMWNFFGDHNKPHGTYYKNSGDSFCTYWNLYDQVMIRPELRKRFVDDSLKIITKVEDINLLDKKGHPNKTISDHLPIIFEIKEN